MTASKKWDALTTADFARFFGIPSVRLHRMVTDFIRAHDFRYRRLNQSERDATIVKILTYLHTASPSPRAANGDGRTRWEREWGKTYRTFVAGDRHPELLLPPWFCVPQAVRLDGDYAFPQSRDFKRNYFEVLLRWFASTYVSTARTVHEFGCGSGFNVLRMAELLPHAEIHGSDWSPYAAKIIDAARLHRGLRVSGHQFNMLSPRTDFRLPPHTAVVTIGALEQLHTRFKPFLRYLLAQKPMLVAHLEPMVEWYDTETLFGWLGARFHTTRRYLHGFVPYLRALETQGKIRILKARRAQMGSLYHDSYSVIVWKPR